MKRSKRKILFISHCSHLGGAEVVLLRFLEKMTDCVPILLSPDGRLTDTAREKGIRVIQSKYLRKLNKEANGFWPVHFIYRFIGSQIELLSLLAKIKPDAVQSNSYYAMIYCGIPCLFLKLPLVWHMHDIVQKKRAHKYLCWLFHLFSTKIIAVSGAVKRSLTVSGINPKKIKTIYNSISQEQLSNLDLNLQSELRMLKGDNTILLGLLATIEERKGHRECIKCIDILVNKYNQNIHFVIAGEAKSLSNKRYLNELNQMIVEKKLQESVSFIGRIEAVRTFLNNIDIFVHFPKYPDSLPTVILEALLCRCKVIVSDNGGNPECVQFGRWGRIVPTGNVKRLAEEIMKADFPPFSHDEHTQFVHFFSHAKKEKAHMLLYDDILKTR